MTVQMWYPTSNVPPYIRTKGPTDRVRAKTVEQESRGDEETPAKRERYACVLCRATVTAPEHQTSLDGDTLHVFSNPAGFTFGIRLFAWAPGARSEGEPTLEHTWFPGWAWAYALCGQCGTHLGWSFSKADTTVFGLIVDRLVLVDV